MRRLERAFRISGGVLVVLGAAGLALAVVVLAVTGLTDAGTDEPGTYVVLAIVAMSQIALGVAVLSATRPAPPARR